MVLDCYCRSRYTEIIHSMVHPVISVEIVSVVVSKVFMQNRTIMISIE